LVNSQFLILNSQFSFLGLALRVGRPTSGILVAHPEEGVYNGAMVSAADRVFELPSRFLADHSKLRIET
jgi:hypothetical protein